MESCGTNLIRNFRTKMLRLLNTPCNIIIWWDTMTTSCFVSCKDKTPKEFQSSIVYKFSCPGYPKSYIGKTDRCLYIRLNEHAKTDKHSEIYKHINDCEHFTYINNLLKLNIDEFDTNERFDLTLFLLHNCTILDKAKHWPVLLFKEQRSTRNSQAKAGTQPWHQSVSRTNSFLRVDIELQLSV